MDRHTAAWRSFRSASIWANWRASIIQMQRIPVDLDSAVLIIEGRR